MSYSRELLNKIAFHHRCYGDEDKQAALKPVLPEPVARNISDSYEPCDGIMRCIIIWKVML